MGGGSLSMDVGHPVVGILYLPAPSQLLPVPAVHHEVVPQLPQAVGPVRPLGWSFRCPSRLSVQKRNKTIGCVKWHTITPGHWSLVTVSCHELNAWAVGSSRAEWLLRGSAGCQPTGALLRGLTWSLGWRGPTAGPECPAS